MGALAETLSLIAALIGGAAYLWQVEHPRRWLGLSPIALFIAGQVFVVRFATDDNWLQVYSAGLFFMMLGAAVGVLLFTHLPTPFDDPPRATEARPAPREATRSGDEER